MALSRGITYANLLFCHSIATYKNNKYITITKYNDRKVFDYFNNIFPDNGGTQYFNIPPIYIDDSPCPPKIPRNTFDMLPYTISAASKKTLSNLNSLFDYPTLHLPISGGPILHTTTV